MERGFEDAFKNIQAQALKDLGPWLLFDRTDRTLLQEQEAKKVEGLDDPWL